MDGVSDITARRTKPIAPGINVRMRTGVTGGTRPTYLVRVRTVEWPDRLKFVAYLDDLKRRRDIQTDSDLAEAAGMSHTSISAWRSGRQRPSVVAIHNLADALGVSAQSLAEAGGLVDLLRFGGPAPTSSEQLPPELDRLASFYRDADEAGRTQILDRVRFIIEWWEAVRTPPATRRRKAEQRLP